ncbi:MAG TPA: GYD domain-containing protein [Gaiellaceae bacterium]|nr:GYD domain-containing protein [Gaiellaceae bacterium]
MPIYILLSRLSQQGIQTLKSNPDRLKAVNADVEELGAKVLHQWATLGEFDFVSVVEAPDTATVARVSVALGGRGSTRIETLPALTIDEFVSALG